MGELGIFQRAKELNEEPSLFDQKDETPVSRILAATMRGNAMVQGQEQAKKVASDQADANAKTTFTLKPNPSGGEPVVTIKDAPVSLLNGTQESDVEQAHDTPRLAVESTIAGMKTKSADDPLAPIYDAVDQSLGYHMARPNDGDIMEKLKTPDGIRQLTIEMGGTKKEADGALKRLRNGELTVERMRDRVAAFRAKKLNAVYATLEKPLNEAQDITDRRAKVGEAETKQTDNDLKNFYDFAKADNLRTFLDNDSMTSAATDAGFKMTPRRQAQLINAREEAHVSDLRKNKAIGTFESFADLKQSLGVNVSPVREGELLADYKAARNAYVTADARAKKDLELKAEELRVKRQAVANIVTKQEQARDIADAIVSGKQPPEFKSMYGLTGPVRSELSKRGYDLERASLDWQATTKHISTLNGPQQTRLRQAVGAAYDQLDVVEGLYAELRKELPASGIKVFNKAALATAKNLPGKAGASAQALEGQIALLTGELGNTLMGGNSPTDHALGLAGQMLSTDWNEETFAKALKQLRVDLRIRQNSLNNSGPAGLSTPPKGAIITDESAILSIFGKSQ